ncbi:MAG: PAS domain S-box protein [Deltaproteobacteria bacterium]|nr:PAS domain S-box protein [Deltaproteobacteria bacterium]
MKGTDCSRRFVSDAHEGMRLVIDAAPLGMVIFNDRARVDYANPQAETFFGPRAAAVEHPTCGEFLACANRHDDPRGCGHAPACSQCPLFQTISAILAGPEDSPCCEGELPLNRDPGFPALWIKYKISPLLLDRRRWAVLTADDITRHKQAEEELRQANAFLTSIFENIPTMVFIKDAKDLRFVRFNRAGEELLGHSREELFGRNDYDFFPREQADFFVEKDREVLRGKRVVDIPEEKLLTKNRGERILYTKKVPVCDERGEPAYLLGISMDITEHKRSLDALADKERYLQTILATNLDGFLVLDPDGTIQEANQAFCAMTGYAQDELPGMNVTRLKAVPDPSVTAKWNQRIIEKGSAFFEHRYRRKDGSLIDVEVSVRFIALDGGKLVAFWRDISERKKAERELAHSHELMRYVIEHSRSAIAVHDRDLRYIYVSQRYLDEYHVKDADIIGRHHYEVLPDIPRKWRDVHQRALAGEILSAEEDSYLRGDGSVEWTRWECRPWYRADGDVGGIVIYTELITARKQAEQQLQASEALYHALFDATPLGLSIQDWDDFSFIEANQAFLDLYGFSGGAIKGFRPTHFCTFREAGDEDQERRLLGQLRAGEVVHAEIRDRNRKGETIWVAKTIRKVTLHGMERIMTFAQDITEKKQMQDFLIQNEKVMSLGVLAAGMAHEINNPLGIISQGVQNVLRRTREPIPGNLQAAAECQISFAGLNRYLEERNVFRSLEAVREAVLRSAALVATMLEFARKPETCCSPHDINYLLEKTIELAATDYDLKKKYDFRNIRIEADFALRDQVPCVASELEQVFLNLLRNSAQSLRQAQREAPVIRLRTYRKDGWAVVEVEDNGTGIAPGIRKKIFDPFFTTKKIGEGTGLGLSVSFHIIVQRHLGEMLVESEEGAWTRFIVRLPLAQGTPRQPRA